MFVAQKDKNNQVPEERHTIDVVPPELYFFSNKRLQTFRFSGTNNPYLNRTY